MQLQQSKNTVREYFQIDLLNLTEVTAIATQVRNKNDIKTTFVTVNEYISLGSEKKSKASIQKPLSSPSEHYTSLKLVSERYFECDGGFSHQKHAMSASNSL